MAKAMKSDKRGAKGEKHARKGRRTWNVYTRRALKQVNKDLTMSSKTAKVANSFVNDIFERIATEAAALVRATKKRTLGSSEVQTAVRLVLPAELAKHAIAEGTKAVKAASA